MLNVKKTLKKNDVIKEMYIKGNKRFVAFLVKISPTLATKYLYKKAMGNKLNLNKPKDFNEKIQWLKLNWQHPLVLKCTDKYEVREYVKKCGCGNILNELYGVYNDVSEINWSKLPNKFVLKTTNSCATNIICDDKSKLDKKKALKKLNQWMKTDNGLFYAEIHYSKITPRIICEKYIETKSGLFPIDYKFFCFNGVPKFVYVGIERKTKLKKIFMDLNWKTMDVLKESSTNSYSVKKPRSFKQMVKCAKKLSKPFPFVRIDFYDLNGEAIFGEMTFTPTGGLATYYNEKALKTLGDMIHLPENKIFNYKL